MRMSGVPDNKCHRILTNTGKHSVEVNVRIRKANEREQSPVASTPHPATHGSIGAFRPGSWADLLQRPPVPVVGPKVVSTTGTRKAHPRLNCATQTDNGSEVGTKEELCNTIRDLHNVCRSLKNEVSELHLSKEKMQSELLGIIREKDKIITAYQNRPPMEPVEHRPRQKRERNRFQHFMRDLDNVIKKEMVESKKRQPAFHLGNMNKTRIHTSRPDAYFGRKGDGDGRREYDFNDEEFNMSNTFATPIMDELLRELDMSSTQYLDLEFT